MPWNARVDSTPMRVGVDLDTANKHPLLICHHVRGDKMAALQVLVPVPGRLRLMFGLVALVRRAKHSLRWPSGILSSSSSSVADLPRGGLSTGIGDGAYALGPLARGEVHERLRAVVGVCVLGFAGEMWVTTTPGVSVCVGVMESWARLELGSWDVCMGAMACSSVGVVGKGACVKGQT